MKNTLLVILLLFGYYGYSQTTLVIRPDSSTSFSAQVIDYPGQLNANYGNHSVMAAHIWTNGSVTWRMRSFIKFDLSAIPSNATILSASLDLYADNPTTTFSGNPSTPMNGTNNACTLRRIVNNWDFSTINWNNQPNDTSLNQAILPTSLSGGQDYLGTDVRQLVQDQLTYGNYGFKITPVATQPSNSMIFRTGTYPDINYRPRLTVVYTTDSISADLGADKESCAGSTVILNAANNGGFPPFTYSWQTTGDTLSCTDCKNPTATITQNSVFICTITDAHNNTATDTVYYALSSGVNQLQASFVNTHISCLQPVDTTTAAVLNAVLPVTYNWGDGFTSVGSTEEIHHYLQSGIYVIEITDSTGCAISVFDTITNSSVSVSLANAVRPTCVEDATGSITLNVTGGTAPYQYHWVNGNTNDSLLGITSGAYTLTVTDAAGCSALFYHNLAPVNDVWGYYVYVQSTSANCSANGSVVALASNGVAPYSYLWNTGSAGQSITGLSGGVYSVVVTDSSGCSRQAEAIVDSSCVSFIKGYVYVDADNDCIFDAGETPVTSLTVKATGSNSVYYGYTLADGSYTMAVSDTGVYRISTSNYGIGCGTITYCGDTSQLVQLNAAGDTIPAAGFAANVSSEFDLALHAGWTASNPGFPKTYWFAPYNHASTAFNGNATVTFNYDPRIEYLYSETPIPVHDSANHTLTWVLGSLPSPTWIHSFLRPTSYFRVPLTLSVGDTLYSSYDIQPVSGDCDTSNNARNFQEIVTGSFDPNEKNVTPERSISPSDSVLTYTIHFQNTGNDSTWFVILCDTLSPLLDASTVQNIASSHPYSEFSVSGKGTLKWVFNPLRLVDSVTNPTGSKGFVMFTVKKFADAPVGAIISNKASIYFDYNEPVVTNTVSDTVMNPLVLNLSGAGTTCGSSNGSATVAAIGGVPPFTYHWDNNATTTTLQSLAGGNYVVTVTDAYGNSVAGTQTVAASTGINDAVITASQTSICSTDSSAICAPSGYAYLWNTGAVSQCITAKQAGGYYVTVTDNSNCTAESNHLTVSVFSTPPVSISVSGDTLRAYNAAAYQWYFNGEEIPGATSELLVANQSGQYSVLVSSVEGCSAMSNLVNITTGINDPVNGFIKVYPNPVSGSANWRMEVDQNWVGSTVTIYDGNGRIVDSFEITRLYTEINAVKEAGVYTARIVSGERCYSVRLVKL